MRGRLKATNLCLVPMSISISILQGFHWPKVHIIVKFNVICTTYEIIYHAAPIYLNDLQGTYTPPRNLRIKSIGGINLNQ